MGDGILCDGMPGDGMPGDGMPGDGMSTGHTIGTIGTIEVVWYGGYWQGAWCTGICVPR